MPVTSFLSILYLLSVGWLVKSNKFRCPRCDDFQGRVIEVFFIIQIFDNQPLQTYGHHANLILLSYGQIHPFNKCFCKTGVVYCVKHILYFEKEILYVCIFPSKIALKSQ